MTTKLPMVTLDWHGFTRLVPKPKKHGEGIAVPMQVVLRGAGVDPWAPLEGNEDTLLVLTGRFKMAGCRYVCVGCPI